MNNSSLLSISPIDGRYAKETKELNNFFSEHAYLKYRVFIEIKYLIALSDIKIIRKLKTKEVKLLNNIAKNFDIKESNRIKKIETITNHDVKAIEYYIKENLNKTTMKDIAPFIHFGLTSEDINNIAIRLMIKESSEKIILPEINNLNKQIYKNYKNYKSLPMIARTHGQKAVPTTLGKEFYVFYQRLENEIKSINKIKLKAKLNGAVGNYNALYYAYPKIKWKTFSKNFLTSLSLDTNLVTNQIAPYDDIVSFFQSIQRVNGIILDLNQDMWRYISDGYFNQKIITKEVGSSTMPQKVNPINFENSEGNIIIANSLIEGFTNKLPISRLQRDLSGSTISRNFGVTLSHSYLAYKNTQKGLSKIYADKELLSNEINKDWSILSEGIQTYLKKEGIENGYELLKELTRGKLINEKDYKELIDNLPLSSRQKKHLLKLTPVNYIGINF